MGQGEAGEEEQLDGSGGGTDCSEQGADEGGEREEDGGEELDGMQEGDTKRGKEGTKRRKRRRRGAPGRPRL